MTVDGPPLGEARCVTRGRVTVEYYARGSGPVVLLLPALANSVREFNPLVERLNDVGFCTLAVQFPGIGRSWRPFRPRLRLADLADDLMQVLQHAGVNDAERAHLVGRGLGNRVARSFASRYPHRTSKVVLLAAGGHGQGRPPAGVMLRHLLLQLPVWPLSMRRRLLEQNVCVGRNVLPDAACRRPPLAATLRQAGAARRTDSREWWGAGSAPVLILQGEQDKVAPAESARELQQTFPDRVQLQMIPNAGHSLLYECPEIVIPRVVEFLHQPRP